jgi:hypothetical protein
MPHSMVATTLFDFASIRETLPSPWLIVQTAPSPVLMNRGPGPTGIVASMTFVRGFTRVTTFFSVLDTQTAPSPNVTAYEPGAT